MNIRSNDDVDRVASLIPKGAVGDPMSSQSAFRYAFIVLYRAGNSKEEAVRMAALEAGWANPDFEPKLLEGFWEA